MASNLVSRFFGGQSIYETLRQEDEIQRDLFLENEDNVETPLPQRQTTQQPGRIRLRPDSHGSLRQPLVQQHSGHGLEDSPPLSQAEDLPPAPRHPSKSVLDHDEDAPPASFLIEGPPHSPNEIFADDETGRQALLSNDELRGQNQLQPSLAGFPPPPSSMFEPPWNQHNEQEVQDRRPRSLIPKPTHRGAIDPHQRAMYKWANVEDVDGFLRQVYDYYLGKGIYCICLSRIIGLLTVAFIVGFSTFMTLCIDYKKVPNSDKLSEIKIESCMTGMSLFSTFLLWVFCVMWTIKMVMNIFDVRRLYEIHQFYHYLLDIPDMDIQTVSWQDVVQKLMSLRDSNPITSLAATRKYVSNFTSKQRMDAHDIANRLMRRENYLIALFNKDILDLSIPLPFLQNHWLLTRTVEWNLNLSILDFVFHDGHNFNPVFLKESARKDLSKALRSRFLVFGVLNILLAPFIVAYLILRYFLEYFIEYRKNPSAIGSRQYTPLAEWKFREFNELVHLFHRRMNLSYPFAARYLDQFPKEKTVQIARFIALVTGSFAAVLAIASLIDPDLFLGFEITKDRTVLFYIGVFTTITAVARGTIPGESEVFDPAAELSWVIYHTRYNPPEWRGRLHSDEVKNDFAKLYQMKIFIFLWEVASIILTPFVLWFSLPKCSDKIVDFFREFTVHVDGIGYVCSFAEFDFNMAGVGKTNLANGREEYIDTRDHKMMSSIMGFLENYSAPRPAHVTSQQNSAIQRAPALSPTAVQDGHSVLQQRRKAQNFGSHSQQFGLHSAYRGQTSALLDRHHQPIVPHARTLRQSVYQYSTPNRDNLLREEDEEAEADGHYVSNLGESFMSTRLEDDHPQAPPPPDPAGGGVMDLLRQFERYRTQV